MHGLQIVKKREKRKLALERKREKKIKEKNYNIYIYLFFSPSLSRCMWVSQCMCGIEMAFIMHCIVCIARAENVSISLLFFSLASGFFYFLFQSKFKSCKKFKTPFCVRCRGTFALRVRFRKRKKKETFN